MSRSPKVSVVCISYNQEKQIKDALDGFLKQNTNFDIEVLVGDDSSTDNTPLILQEYAAKHPNVIKPILRKKNLGPQQNFSDVYSRAKGEYIALCEGDDYWTDPNKLQIQVDLMDANPSYSLSFHAVEILFENDSQKPYRFPAENDNQFNLKRLLKENFIQTNSVMYRQQKNTKIPTDILPLDWYMHLYHAQFGQIGYINRVMSVYRRHAGGIWWESHSNIDKLWKKHGLAHLKLYNEINKLFGSNTTYKGLIDNAILSLLSTFMRLDSVEGGNKLTHSALEINPEYKEPLLLYQQGIQEEIIRDKVEFIDDQAKVIEHLKNELEDQKRQLSFTQEQLTIANIELQKLNSKRLRIVQERLSRKKHD